MARRRYTDKFRASAVVMLEAAGYPDKKGALSEVADHLKVPLSTLRGWHNQSHNPPPAEVRNEKKGDLTALIESELHGIFGDMSNARLDASYRDLATAAGILVDKMQLLTGKPTDIVESRESPLDELRRRLYGIKAKSRDREDTPHVNGNGRGDPAV